MGGERNLEGFSVEAGFKVQRESMNMYKEILEFKQG